MSAKRSSNEAEAPHTAIIPQPAHKTNVGTDIFLPDDVLRLIVTFADFKGLPALACACKATRDAARDEDMLARDKVYVLRCWLVMGGNEDTLRRGYRVDAYNLKMRDEPSDNVSEWFGVVVEGERVTMLDWDTALLMLIGEGSLTGTIPAEIGAFDCLTWLVLGYNQICGHLPLEIGRLTSLSHLHLQHNRLEGHLPSELGALTALTDLHLDNNNLTGEIPSTLANLTSVKDLSLHGNKFDTDVPSHLIKDRWEAQEYLATLRPNHNMHE